MGFFEVAEAIWAEADQRREGFQTQLGEDLGDFIADVRQYGAAWMGDIWEWTAIGSEDHMAFATIPETHPWDEGNYGFVVSTSEGGSHPSYSSGWGGWRKPHKEPPGPTNEDGMVRGRAVRISEPNAEGLCTYIFMAESYL